MKTVLSACLIAIGFASAPAGGEENRCGVPRSQEADEICAGLTQFLPHFADSFDSSLLNGRYALDCSAPSGIELSGLAQGAGITVKVNGAEVTRAYRPKAYFGPSSAPLGFILPIAYTNPLTGAEQTLSVNGDHQGFYLLDDWDGIRRLSKCPGDAG